MRQVLTLWKADLHARYNNQKSECMEEAARIIAKAFSNCLTDRYAHTMSYFKVFTNFLRERHPTRYRESGESTMLWASSSNVISEWVSAPCLPIRLKLMHGASSGQTDIIVQKHSACPWSQRNTSSCRIPKITPGEGIIVSNLDY